MGATGAFPSLLNLGDVGITALDGPSDAGGRTAISVRFGSRRLVGGISDFWLVLPVPTDGHSNASDLSRMLSIAVYRDLRLYARHVDAMRAHNVDSRCPVLHVSRSTHRAYLEETCKLPQNHCTREKI